MTDIRTTSNIMKPNRIVGLMAVLGLLSGSISTFTPESIKSALNPISEKLGIDGIGLFPGLIFAALFAFAIAVFQSQERSRRWRDGLLAYGTTVLAWVCAVHAALAVYDLFDGPGSLVHWFGNQNGSLQEIEQRLITGVIAGGLGAAILFLGCALFFSSLRCWKLIACGCLIGATAGLFLWSALESDLEYLGPWLLFAIWQSSIAAWLAYMMTRPEQKNRISEI